MILIKFKYKKISVHPLYDIGVSLACIGVESKLYSEQQSHDD